MTTDLLLLLHSSRKLMTTGINREKEVCTPQQSCHKLASDAAIQLALIKLLKLFIIQPAINNTRFLRET